MSTSDQKPSAGDSNTRTKRYVIEQPLKDCWIAHSASDPISGFILFNKRTRKIHAWFSEAGIHFPPLARANYSSPEDCPVDEHHRPRADFLMLLALRNRFKEYMPGSDFVAYSRRMSAFERRRQEIEETTGKLVSEANWKECQRIASSSQQFEVYATNWLANLIQKDDASKTLIRFGRWLERAEEFENAVIPPQYTRFYSAVEKAALDTDGIPTQKEVRAIYEKGLSANQLGRGHGFRAVMIQLHFEWLPAGGRGKSVQH